MSVTFFIEVILLGLILSADSFSAAVAMGSRKFSRKELLTFAAASGVAEALAAVAGFFAGSRIIKTIADYDHWVAFSLLFIIALHLLYEGFTDLFKKKTEAQEVEPEELGHGFLKIMVVALATSLDAFGVGIGLGVASSPILAFAVSIGVWAFIATVVGVYIGNRASKRIGPFFTIIAGFVLIILSVKMLDI